MFILCNYCLRFLNTAGTASQGQRTEDNDNDNDVPAVGSGVYALTRGTLVLL